MFHCLWWLRFSWSQGKPLSIKAIKKNNVNYVYWVASSEIAGGSLKSHYRLITSCSARCARVASPSYCLSSGKSPVLRDPSAPPAALDAQQRLRGSVGPRDVRGGWEVARCCGAWRSIAQSCQGPEAPVHRLFPPGPPAERVSLPPSSSGSLRSL